VYRAMKFLNDAFEARGVGFDGEEMSDVAKAMQYGKEEQCALAEGLLRAWWAFEGERFLSTFEVLEVEKEGRAALTEKIAGPWEEDIRPEEGHYVKDELVLMFRPDALVRERETGDLYIISWKTCSTFSKRTIDQAKHDTQSMSEAWGWMESHNHRGGEYTQGRHAQIEGVLYKWIVKGSRRKDEWDGLYKQGSHLVYGWVKLATEKSEFPEWSWCYEFETEDGKNSRLGKGWQKKPIWSAYPGGVKAWVEALSHNEIFPRHVNALEAVFPQAMPVERRADEIESWKRQVVAQETPIPMKAEAVESSPTEEIRQEALDIHFPQHTHSCHSYSGCPFLDVCWGGPEIASDPIGSGLYEPRSQNHPEYQGDE
jgi:hypothetical protein